MWVVPCFNEAQRLDAAKLEALIAHAGTEVLLVDDGSTDGTLPLLRTFAAQWPDQVSVLALERNGGKAEAVRQGLLAASARATVVGYADADFATPPRELHRLAAELEARSAQVVLGSRVALAGRDIRRKPVRHYLGRAFGTIASLLLDTVVYDTQCGAKLFRTGPALAQALAEPFGSRWVFDVELLGRLLIGAPGVPGVPVEALVEVPLEAWADVAGSKLRASALAKVPLELVQLARRLEARRRQQMQ